MANERSARKYESRTKHLLSGWLDLRALDQQRQQLGELLLEEITRIPSLPHLLKYLKSLPESERDAGVLYVALLPKAETSEILGWNKVNEVLDKFPKILKAAKALHRENLRSAILPNRTAYAVAVSSSEPLTKGNLEILKRSVSSEVEASLRKMIGQPLADRFTVAVGAAGCRLSGIAVHEARDIKLHRLAADTVERAMQGAVAKDQGKADRDGFLKAAQPIVDLESGRTVGHEASLRFIDLAQDPDFDRTRSVFFNLDPHVTGEPVFRDIARRLLDAPSTPARARVVFEITERSIAGDFDQFQLVFRYFHALGFKLALDNARADYASLETAKELRPDFIRIGQSLTGGIDEDEIKQNLIVPLVALATKAQVPLIAKGIETKAQAETLKRVGIRYGQGPLF